MRRVDQPVTPGVNMNHRSAMPGQGALHGQYAAGSRGHTGYDMFQVDWFCESEFGFAQGICYAYATGYGTN